MTNETTWDCPAYVLSFLLNSRCLQVKETQPSKQATVTSSNKTFIRCAGCGGWGTDLVRPSGKCAHCEQKGTRRAVAASAQHPVMTQPSVHSNAADIYMMQPRLSMYKKRPRTPFSRI